MRRTRFVFLALALALLVAACGRQGSGDAGTITIETLQDGQVVSSNVLVRGSFPSGINVLKLAYRVNDGEEIDVTATIDGRTFVFSISGSLFEVGPNVIRFILREVAGGSLTRTINVVFDPSVAPPSGGDLVVFNDINLFDNTAMGDANNVRFGQNLVNFSSGGVRGAGTVVLFDRGRNSICFSTGECGDDSIATMISTIEDEGFSLSSVNSTAGSITSIPADVKLIFLWMPMVEFTPAEVNTLKQFAAEGGRIVFIGEYQSYYTLTGLNVQNRFLEDMGAQLTNTGGEFDCGYTVLPFVSLRPSAITEGLEQLTIACASEIVLGPNDYALFYDTTNTRLLAGVASIDVTPLPLVAEPVAVPASPVPTALPSATASGL